MDWHRWLNLIALAIGVLLVIIAVVSPGPDPVLAIVGMAIMIYNFYALYTKGGD